METSLTTIPYAYQIKDARQIHRMGGRVLLANEMGTGKSLITLLYALRHPELRPMVVVCPASLRWVWEREAKTHFGLRTEVLEGTKPPLYRLGATKHQFVIVNYDILGQRQAEGAGPGWLPFLKALKPQLVVLDECHYCSGRTTSRTRWVRELCRDVPHVLALSGTPLTNRPAEMWSVLNILRPKEFPAFWPYAHRYCGARRTPWGWDVRGASHLDELHEKLLKTCLIRRRKADVLSELPDKVRSVLPIPLPDRSEYDEALSDFLGWVKKQGGPEKARKAMKAQTLVRMGELKRLAARLKLPLVKEWIKNFLEETDGKLVCFAVHKAIIKELHTTFPESVVVDGSITGKQRKLAVDKFQHDRKTRLFIGNVKAAGVGLTLTASSTVLFAELAWTPGEHVQAEDRCHRIGTKSSVSVNYIVARETIEELLCDVIQRKQRTLSAVLDGGVGDSLDVYDELLKALEGKP